MQKNIYDDLSMSNIYYLIPISNHIAHIYMNILRSKIFLTKKNDHNINLATTNIAF